MTVEFYNYDSFQLGQKKDIHRFKSIKGGTLNLKLHKISKCYEIHFVKVTLFLH